MMMTRTKLLQTILWLSLLTDCFALWTKFRKHGGMKNLRRRGLQTDNNNGEESLVSSFRILSFGTSRAWGAGLKDRYHQAYPYLLSKDVTNLAIRATGSAYPSTCTYSMVGDGAYDVILLEFNHVMNEKQEFQSLAKKLRKRFPDATMIFINSWSPFQFLHTSSNQHACLRKRELFPSRKLQMNESQSVVWDSVVANSTLDEWRFIDNIKSKKIIKETAALVNGILWEFPRHDEDHVETMKHYGPMFLHDCNHYSEMGHQFIKKELETIILKRAKHSDNLGPWERLDQCEKWFETGQLNDVSSDMKMVQFQPDKFALEASGPKHFIELRNRLARKVQVHLSCMMTGPQRIYPTVSIDMNRQLTTINPLVTEKLDHPVHVSGMNLLGEAGPGELVHIELEPLEITGHPFRIIGISMLESQSSSSSSSSTTTTTSTNTTFQSEPTEGISITEENQSQQQKQPENIVSVQAESPQEIAISLDENRKEQHKHPHIPIFGSLRDFLLRRRRHNQDYIKNRLANEAAPIVVTSPPKRDPNEHPDSLPESLIETIKESQEGLLTYLGKQAGQPSGDPLAMLWKPIKRETTKRNSIVSVDQHREVQQQTTDQQETAAKPQEETIQIEIEEPPESKERSMSRLRYSEPWQTDAETLPESIKALVIERERFKKGDSPSANDNNEVGNNEDQETFDPDVAFRLQHRRLTGLMADPKTISRKTKSRSSSPLCGKPKKKKLGLGARLNQQRAQGRPTPSPTACVQTEAPSMAPTSAEPTFNPTTQPRKKKKRKKVGLHALLGKQK